jgi:uncharacterized protein YndB with AHSA1/START domain
MALTGEPLPLAAAIRLERVLPAPVAEVFAAWTDPARMARWLAPTGYAEVEADLRVGGRFQVTMIDDDVRIEHTGEYLVIDPPHRLSFTWLSPYTGGAASQVDITLTARGPATHLVLSHQRLPDETRSSHEGGWASILDRLAAVVADRTSPTCPSSTEGMS